MAVRLGASHLPEQGESRKFQFPLRKLQRERAFAARQRVDFDDQPLRGQVRHRHFQIIEALLRDHAQARAARALVKIALRIRLVDEPGEIPGINQLAFGPQNHERHYRHGRVCDIARNGDSRVLLTSGPKQDVARTRAVAINMALKRIERRCPQVEFLLPLQITQLQRRNFALWCRFKPRASGVSSLNLT